MELPTIDVIKEKLDVIPPSHYKDILQYLNFLTYQDNTGFQLTNRHLEILEESSKTPIDKCKPAQQVLDEMRKKYAI
jgi:hypothetical protein